MLQDCLRLFLRNLIQGIQNTVSTEHFRILVGRFGQAVGIHEDPAARLQLHLILRIRCFCHGTDHQPVLVLEVFIVPLRMPESRIFMAGIGSLEAAGGQFQNSQPDGHKHLRIIAGADILIGSGQDLTRIITEYGNTLQDDLGSHHEQRRRHTLAGNIGDHQAQMIIINQEVIIEVTADFLGRIHGSIDIEVRPVRESREVMRQHALLNILRQGQLGSDSLLFGRYRLDRFHILDRLMGLFGKTLGQLLDLIAGAEGVFHLELKILAGQMRDSLGHGVERLDHPFNTGMGHNTHADGNRQHKYKRGCL